MPRPGPWASFSLRSPECDLCLILPGCFLVLASFQANPQPFGHVCPGCASLRVEARALHLAFEDALESKTEQASFPASIYKETPFPHLFTPA